MHDGRQLDNTVDRVLHQGGSEMTSSTQADSKGFLHITAYKGRPFYEARWRDLNQTQRRRRLGAAWVEADAGGE